MSWLVHESGLNIRPACAEVVRLLVRKQCRCSVVGCSGTFGLFEVFGHFGGRAWAIGVPLFPINAPLLTGALRFICLFNSGFNAHRAATSLGVVGCAVSSSSSNSER